MIYSYSHLPICSTIHPPTPPTHPQTNSIEIEWKGERGSVEEEGYNKADPEHVLVKIDPQYFRPTEVELLLGDPTKAKKHIGYVSPSTHPPTFP